MTFHAKAIYTQGVLKPFQPLPLHDRQTVDVEITPVEKALPAIQNDFSSLYGVWKGSSDAMETELASVRRMAKERLDRKANELL